MSLAGKDDIQTSTTKKSTPARPQEPPVRCPRCDSPNTKFCYYNNYSLSQPRHFCKTCRRYWTKGGALRNVPIGGGCRKNKKIKSSSSAASSGSSDGGGAIKFFQGLSPATEFPLHAPPITAANNIFHQFSSAAFGNSSNTSGAISQTTPCFNLDPSLMGFAFPLPSPLKQGELQQEMGFNLASSIESLSSINQDLHWKLQQQRLATLYAEEEGVKEASGSVQKLQPIQFQNLENPKTDSSCMINGTSRKEGSCFSNTTDQWYLNNSYAAAVAPAVGSSGSAANWSTSGIQAWSSELTQYASLP